MVRTDRASIFTVPKPGTAPTPPPDVGAITPTSWADLTGSFSTFTTSATPGPSLGVLKIVGYQLFNAAAPLLSVGFTTLNFEASNQPTPPAADVWQTWTLDSTAPVWQTNQSDEPRFCPQGPVCSPTSPLTIRRCLG